MKSCLVCQQDKTERRKETGLLHPLPVPERPWQLNSIDFILAFPKVDWFKSIMVVVKIFSKYSIFIPIPHECTSNVAVELFFGNVVK